jgi:hypothetical protein
MMVIRLCRLHASGNAPGLHAFVTPPPASRRTCVSSRSWHVLRLTFEDGTVGDVGFGDREWTGVFEPLRDPAALREGASRSGDHRLARGWPRHGTRAALRRGEAPPDYAPAVETPSVQLERPLQVADVATDLVVLGVAGRLPKRNSNVVLVGDESGYPVGALPAQVLLAGSH